MTADSHNPYSPPSATVADSELANDAPRPKAIPILQFLNLFPIAGLLYGLFRTAQVLGAIQMRGISWAAFWVGIGLRLVVLLLLIWMVVGLQRRWNSGRWLSVLWMAALIIFAAFVIVGQIRLATSQSSGYLVGLFVGFLVISVPLGLLAFYSAFSARARAYFAKPR